MVTDTHFLNYNIFTKGLPPDEHRHDDTISLIFLVCNSVIQESAGTQYLSNKKPEMEAKLTLNGLLPEHALIESDLSIERSF